MSYDSDNALWIRENMYRHHQHLLNDESSNRDLKKPSKGPVNGSHEKTNRDKCVLSKTINPGVATVSKVMNPLRVNYRPEKDIPKTTPPETGQDAHITASKPMNPLNVNYRPDNNIPESSPAETIVNRHITGEQDGEKKTNVLKARTTAITEPMRWPEIDDSIAETKRNYKWIFILAGIIVGVVSGFFTYTEVARSDKNDFVLLLKSASEKESEAPDFVADNIVYKEADHDYSNEVIKTAVAETDEDVAVINDIDANPEIIFAANIPTEVANNDTADIMDETNTHVSNDSNIAEAADDISDIKEPFMVSSSGAASDISDKIEPTPLKEDRALAMNQPSEHMKESTNVAAEKKILINQKPEVLITKSDTKEAAGLSLKKEKIDQLARVLALHDITTHKDQIDLTGNVLSGNDKTVEEDMSLGEIVYVGPALREQAPVIKELLKTGSPALIISESEHNTPIEATVVADALTDKKSIPSLKSYKSEQADNEKKIDYKYVKGTPAIHKEIIDEEGQRHSGAALLAKHNKSGPKNNGFPDFQPVKTVAMKEMSVTYEDQFNEHNNNWPEYNNDRASVLIEEGEYRVEHMAVSGYHIVLHPYGVPNEMNYMIHIAISSVRGSGKHSYGFVLGGKDNINNYSFQIHSDNSYSIKKRVNGQESELSRGHIDNVFISKSSGKTLKIVKLNNKVRFYVDDYYFDELSAVEFPGDKVGFLVEGQVKIAVDSTRTEIKYSSN